MDESDLVALLHSSDDHLAHLILLATGVPPLPADIARWRSALGRLLYRVRRAREPDPDFVAPSGRNRAREAVEDFLSSAEAAAIVPLCGLAAAAALTATAVVIIAAARAVFWLRSAARAAPPLSDLDRVHAYAAAKLVEGGATTADFCVAPRDRSHRAAINAAASDDLAHMCARVARTRLAVVRAPTVESAARRSAAVLDDLCEAGNTVLAAYPELCLDEFMIGPPLVLATRAARRPHLPAETEAAAATTLDRGRK